MTQAEPVHGAPAQAQPAARPGWAGRAARDPLAWVCALALAAGLVLPWIHLGRVPFWVDESIAALPARNIHFDLLPTSPFDLDYMPWQLEYGLWDPATPLYRYSLAAYTALVGFTDFRARSFSVWMGFATAAVFGLLVRRLFDARTALVAVALLVTSATFLIHQREARHFTFVMCLGLTTLWLLHRAARDSDPRAVALWPVGLVATLLAQTLGYALLPLAAATVLWLGPRRFFSRRALPVHAAAAAVYAAVMAAFWHTLPFFHETGCENRPAGCQPEPWYYLRVLYDFLAPLREERFRHTWQDLSPLGPLLFLLGVGATLATRLRGRSREDRVLLLLWSTLPLLLLSTREVKFHRYLFIWLMPICALYVARGVLVAGSALRRPGSRRAAQAALLVAVVLAPRLSREGVEDAWRFQLGLVDYVRTGLLDAPFDNWERLAWQTAFLRQRASERDIVVSSFDDAGLQYYLGRFVHGFLDSRHTDAYFVGLLEKARSDGTTLWFIDSLPDLNFCYDDPDAPRTVDCREKYAAFYAACLAEGSSPCVRVVPPAGAP